MKVEIDSLVRGHAGSTPNVIEARVYRVSPWGWVAGISEDRQVIINDPEAIGLPRLEKDRRDIPERLR